MEPLTALDAGPELIWMIGIVALGVTLAVAMLYASRPNARQHESRNRAQENGKD